MPVITWSGNEVWWSPTNGTAATPTAWSLGHVRYVVGTTITSTATTTILPMVVWSQTPAGWDYLSHVVDQPVMETPSIVRPARFSPPQARRHHDLTERYAREADEARRRGRLADEARAAGVLERQHAQITAHSEQSQQRARELLREHLNPAQRETLERSQWFIVKGRHSQRWYRIHARGSLVANVEVLDSRGLAIHRLCAHCDLGAIPLADQLLAQKLMLEYDETAFLQIANRHAA